MDKFNKIIFVIYVTFLMALTLIVLSEVLGPVEYVNCQRIFIADKIYPDTIVVYASGIYEKHTATTNYFYSHEIGDTVEQCQRKNVWLNYVSVTVLTGNGEE